MKESFYIDIIICVLAFILGAIPFSIVIGKLFYGIDIRKEGSGNPGATNTLRVLGTKAGIVVLLLDVLKGIVAVWVADFAQQINQITTEMLTYIAGGMAILGHIFSPFLKFKGGKGVATATGVVFFLHPFTGLALLGVFVLIVGLTKYVSLASVLSAFALPFINFAVYGRADEATWLFCSLLGALIIYKHKSNITKLLNGDESKVSFIGSRS